MAHRSLSTRLSMTDAFSTAAENVRASIQQNLQPDFSYA
jgi:hypothetical protein